MAQSPTPPETDQWFIEVNGTKTGPYAIDQLLLLLKSGKISSQHRVTSTQLGRWITAGELDQGRSSRFQPPPRPELTPGDRKNDASPDTDPTLTLFDALQVARDQRKPNPPVHPVFEREIKARYSRNRLMTIAAGIIVLFLVGAIIAFKRNAALIASPSSPQPQPKIHFTVPMPPSLKEAFGPKKTQPPHLTNRSRPLPTVRATETDRSDSHDRDHEADRDRDSDRDRNLDDSRNADEPSEGAPNPAAQEGATAPDSEGIPKEPLYKEPPDRDAPPAAVSE